MAWPEGIPAWLKNQWGVLSGQVSERATTSQLINSLRPYAAASSEGWGPRGVIYVSQLRSMAVAIRQAADAITRAAFTGTIDQSMIADAPWSRSPVQQALAPQFMIRALVGSENPESRAGVAGVPANLEQWVTHYTTILPATLGQLVQQITERASATGSPPLPVTSVSRIEILAE